MRDAPTWQCGSHSTIAPESSMASSPVPSPTPQQTESGIVNSHVHPTSQPLPRRHTCPHQKVAQPSPLSPVRFTYWPSNLPGGGGGHESKPLFGMTPVVQSPPLLPTPSLPRCFTWHPAPHHVHPAPHHVHPVPHHVHPAPPHMHPGTPTPHEPLPHHMKSTPLKCIPHPSPEPRTPHTRPALLA